MPFSEGMGRATPAVSSFVTSRAEMTWPSPWIPSCTCAACLSRDRGSAGCRFVKNRSCCPPRIIEERLAGRFVAERVSLLGTMGRFPVIMHPTRKASRLTAVGAERPVPKRSDVSVEIAWRTRTSRAASRTLEKRVPLCNGATPPNPRLMFVMLVASVTLTTLKYEPYRPYQG
jgi:hypothetical protein